MSDYEAAPQQVSVRGNDLEPEIGITYFITLLYLNDSTNYLL